MADMNQEILPQRKRRFLFEILILIAIVTILYVFHIINIITFGSAIFLSVVYFLFRSYIVQQQEELRVRIKEASEKPEEYHNLD